MSDLFSQRDNLFFAQVDAQQAFDLACDLRDATSPGLEYDAAQRKVEALYAELITAQDAYNYAVESGK